MRLFIIALAVVALAAVPSAQASTRDYAFLDTSNTVPTGTLTLSQGDADGGTIALPDNVKVTWADPVALAAPALVQNGQMSYDLWFENYGGFIIVQYGTVTPAGVFTPIGTHQSSIVRTTPSGLIPVPGATMPTDIGRSTATFSLDGELLAGEHIAIRLESTAGNVMMLDESQLGAGSPSSATVPLPELPALVLTALGLMLVAGVVVVRRQRT